MYITYTLLYIECTVVKTTPFSNSESRDLKIDIPFAKITAFGLILQCGRVVVVMKSLSCNAREKILFLDLGYSVIINFATCVRKEWWNIIAIVLSGSRTLARTERWSLTSLAYSCWMMRENVLRTIQLPQKPGNKTRPYARRLCRLTRVLNSSKWNTALLTSCVLVVVIVMMWR